MRWVGVLIGASWALGASALAAPAFEAERWHVVGRVVEAVPFEASGEEWLAVLSVEGLPPREKRVITIGRLGTPLARQTLSERVIAVDFGDLDPAPGPEVLAIEAGALRVLRPDGTLVRSIPLDPALPLPARTRRVSAVAALADWNGLGATEAAIPDVEGFRIVPIVPDGEARRLSMPVLHAAQGMGAGLVDQGAWLAQLIWPTLQLVEDDGDGTLELHAADRFGLSIFRRTSEGLASSPSSRRRFPSFSADEEFRHQTSFLRADSPDLDGDGLADLIVRRTVGTISGARAHAAIHRNRGSGADPSAKPDAVLELKGGFGDASAIDLDADGRHELFQIGVGFGAFQMIRIMTQGRADVDLTLYAVERAGEGLRTREVWSSTISVPFDTAQGRVGTLLPRTDGDWNGDGILDLIHGGPSRLTIRLGKRVEGDVRFGDPIQVELAPAEGSAVGDFDGDGLDELVLFDPVKSGVGIRVLRNRGVLPGSRPQLGPAD